MTESKANQIISGGEPFLYPAGKTGCLLIHGISGSPQAMSLLGQYLAGQGITALGIRLKGHATKITDLDHCRYQDWLGSAVDGLEQLEKNCSAVFCAGLSLGGLIALKLAAQYTSRIHGVITICSPYQLKKIKFKLVPILKKIVKKVPVGPPSINDPQAREIKYAYHSLAAVFELIKLGAIVRRDLPKITQPVLFVGALQDKTVDSGDARLFYEHIGSQQKELLWLNNSQHIATLDYDKELLFTQVTAFIQRHSIDIR